MPRETVRIPDEMELYEAAAMFLEVLAFPADLKARERFGNALCYKMLAALAQDRNFANERQIFRLCHAIQDLRQVEREFQRGMKKIKDRLDAAYMAAPFVLGHLLGRELPVSLRDGELERPTVNLMAREIAIQRDARRRKDTEGDEKNILSRIWTPSKPVIHLSVGLHLTIAESSPGSDGIEVGRVLQDREILCNILDKAEGIRQVLPIPGVKVLERDTIQVLLA